MADETTYIRIEADDSGAKKVSAAFKDLQVQLKLLDTEFRKGNITFVQYKTGIDDIVRSAVKLNLSQKQTADLNSALFLSSQRVQTGFKSMSVSLNEINTTLRARATPAVVSFTQAIQDAPYGLRGMANNIEYLTQQLILMRQAAGSNKEMLGALMAAIKGPMGILLAVSVLTVSMQVLGNAFRSTKKETKETEIAFGEIVEKLHQLGQVTDRQIIRFYELQRAALESQVGLTATKTIFLPGFWTGLIPRRIDVPMLSPEEQEATRSKILDLDKKILAVQKEITDEKRKQTEEWIKSLGRGGLPGITPYGTFEMWKMGLTGREFPTRMGRPELEKLYLRIPEMKSGAEIITAVMEKSQKEGIQLVDILKGGFQDAADYLTEGIRKSLGLGESLIDRLAARAARLGIMAGISGLASLIPGVGTFASIFKVIGSFQHGGWINEPVVGMGLRTRGLYSIAETAPEYVSPANANRMGQAGRFAGGGDGSAAIIKALRSMEWRIRGYDLVAAYDRNAGIRAGRMW